MMTLIGLAGKKGTGKTTAANYLERTHGYTPIALADPIKAALHAMLHLTHEETEGSLKEQPLARYGLDKSPRELMQLLGTEWRELVATNLWLSIADKEITYCTNNKIVITDIRFEHEAAWLRAKGGHIVHIHRPTPARDNHVSEAGVLWHSGDYQVNNNSTLESLIAQLDATATSITGSEQKRTGGGECPAFLQQQAY